MLQFCKKNITLFVGRVMQPKNREFIPCGRMARAYHVGVPLMGRTAREWLYAKQARAPIPAPNTMEVGVYAV